MKIYQVPVESGKIRQIQVNEYPDGSRVMPEGSWETWSIIPAYVYYHTRDKIWYLNFNRVLSDDTIVEAELPLRSIRGVPAG